LSLLKLPLLQLKRKKFRTVILIISVMLAVSLLVGLNAGVAGLQETYRDLVGTSLGYTDLIIKSNTTTPAFGMQTIEPLMKDNSIAAYSYRVQYWMPYASTDGQFNATSGAYLVGVNPQADEEFGAYKIASGNYTSLSDALTNHSGFCVLGESFARRMNVQAGDTLTLGYWNLTEALPPEPSQTMTLTVACIIQDLGRTYTFSSNNPTDFTKVDSGIIVNLDVAQTLYYLKPTDAIDVYVHVQDLTQTSRVQGDLQNALGPDYVVADLKAVMYDSVNQNLGAYQTITYIIGGMALMIAAMLLLNTMLANVSERKREIGVLRSIGASKPQVFAVFLTELLPVALAGALLSIPVSMAAARLITSILPSGYVQNVGVASAVEFSFPLTTLMAGLAIGVVLTLAVGLVPALVACKIKPVEALFPQVRSFHPNRKTKFVLPAAGLALTLLGLFLVQTGFSASTAWFPTATALIGFVATLTGAILLASLVLSPLSKAFSLSLKPFIGRACVIVHRNILLNRRRSVFSYGAFALSIALLVSFSSLVATASSYNLAVTKQSVGADVQVWVNAPADFANQLKVVEGVQNVAGVGYISFGQSNMTFNSHRQDSIMITGITSADYFATIYGAHLTSTLNGMTPQQVYTSVAEGKGIILQDTLAQNLTAHVGDIITWSIINQPSIYQQTLQVIATTDFVAGRWETISNYAQGYYSAIVGFSNMQGFRSYLLAGNFDEFYVSLDSSANTVQVVDRLTQTCTDAGYIPTIYTAKDTLAQTQASFDQTQTLALSVTAFFVLVGALGITAATAYTVAERKREIGTLTALGMDKRQNRTIIAGEAVLLALIGTVVGFASGLGLSLFVVHVIPWWANLPAPSLVLSPLSLLTAAAVIVVSAVLSSVYPAHRISKLNTVEALRQ
jgi:putative ABC transport system permease protein